jgi:hypothetical protein
VSTTGVWDVRLDGSTPVLVLFGSGTQGDREFPITEDARGTVLLGGVPAQVGDPSFVAQIPPRDWR